MFELFEVEEKDKNIIYNLMQLYTYELSFFEDETTNFQLIENGLFKMSKYIELYWTQEKRHPYILKCDGKFFLLFQNSARRFRKKPQIDF